MERSHDVMEVVYEENNDEIEVRLVVDRAIDRTRV